jgi:hypothetical protein
MTLNVSQKGEGGAVTLTEGTSNVLIAIVTTEPCDWQPARQDRPVGDPQGLERNRHGLTRREQASGKL